RIMSLPSLNVPTKSRKAVLEPVSNRVIVERQDNGNRNSCFFGEAVYRRPTGHDDIYLKTHEFGRKFRKPLGFTLGPSRLNDNVFPLHVPKLAQTLPKCVHASRHSCRRERT